MLSDQFVPFHVPSIGEEEIGEVANTLRSGWLTSGPRTHQFEREFAAYVNAPHALAVNSCTSGLHLALAALGLGPGDEVITTPNTFCATVNAIVHVGATPVLADVDEFGNINPLEIAKRISPRTKAILPVHFGGIPCDMLKIWRLAARHSLRVVEDAAHAIGSAIGPHKVGAGDPEAGLFSDCVAYSFYATKNLTTGEGGMVTTHDENLAEKMKVLCLHGLTRDAWNRYGDRASWSYEVVEPGFKYNLSDVQSALGIHQLRKQDQFLLVRNRYVALYRELLGDLEEIELPSVPLGMTSAWHLYVIRLKLDRLNLSRDQFIQELTARRIGVSVHFIPIPLHPAYRDIATLSAEHCPRAMGEFSRIISLPLYPAMTEQQVRRVADTVRSIVAANRRALPGSLQARAATPAANGHVDGGGAARRNGERIGLTNGAGPRNSSGAWRELVRETADKT
jgi:dTDP-4-amino-4,6-dideoxygalactose transaminase